MTHEEIEKLFEAMNGGGAYIDFETNREHGQVCLDGWFDLKPLLDLIASAEKKGREEALKAFNPYPNNPTHKGCECDVCIGRQWNEDKRHG